MSWQNPRARVGSVVYGPNGQPPPVTQNAVIELLRSPQFGSLLLEAQHDVVRARRVTALPTTPTDGDEIDYVADSANGVIHRYRYRAAANSAYRWENPGAPLYAHNGTSSTQNTGAIGTYAALTNTPSLTIPFAGDWIVEFEGSVLSAATYQECRVGLRVNSAASPTFSSWHASSPATADLRDVFKKRRVTLAAGDVLTLLVSTSSATSWTFGHTDGFRLIALPTRVG